MKIAHLTNPFPNGFTDNDLEKATECLLEFQEVYDAIVDGTACIRFVDGDRKGSIARISFRDKAPPRPSFEPYRGGRWNTDITRIMNESYFFCVAKWDDRRNKIQCHVPHSEIEVLLEYDGPTVWQRFDAETAKQEILKNPNQKDINGNVLAIGDSVLYINARYGSRMVLEEGNVAEFAVNVNSKGWTITTIIESKSGEYSSLQYPESMVYKFDT